MYFLPHVQRCFHFFLPPTPPSLHFPLSLLFSFFLSICPFCCLCLSLSHPTHFFVNSVWKITGMSLPLGFSWLGEPYLTDSLIAFLGLNWTSSVVFSQDRQLALPEPVPSSFSCLCALAIAPAFRSDVPPHSSSPFQAAF